MLTLLLLVACSSPAPQTNSDVKTPPASELIKQAAGLSKGSSKPSKEKAGKITKDQVREIATTKLPDLNANDVEAAMKIVEGTARSMGVTVE